MTRPDDLPTQRGIAMGPRDAIFFRWDAPTFQIAMTEADHERLKALVRRELEAEAARQARAPA